MKNCIVLIFLFCSFSGFCQKFSESERSYLSTLEKILKVDTIPFLDKEIRVYKKHEISTGLELFRIYSNDESKVYKAELYETYSKRLNKDSIKTDIRKYELNSIYNLEYLMTKFVLSDIKHVADMEKISYKMNPKASAMVDKGYLYFIEGKPASIVDGYSYYIQVKDDKDFNEIHYSNPERYLELYPTIDELISVNEFLDIIKTSFGVFTDK
ncbi:hypothetical protein NU10_13510 [Flavobacterium dauae]|uniref:hypothetical protein n=1 Tax=Flavobacterium dauae TaxID=1563479 RepID=UPI00101B3D24|nr:hypothetical protein [Flavobacterium dauae]WLD23705.1 hypothetical protein NU10_13510 [Flavobacterium dauae]